MLVWTYVIEESSNLFEVDVSESVSDVADLWDEDFVELHKKLQCAFSDVEGRKMGEKIVADEEACEDKVVDHAFEIVT